MKSLFNLFPYLFRYKKTLLIGFFAIILSNVFGLFVPSVIGDTIDGLQNSIDKRAIFSNIAVIIVTMILSGYFSYLTRQTIIVVSRKIEFDLRNDFFSHTQKLSLEYFQHKPTGELMSIATNDLNAIRNVIGPGIMYTSDTIVIFILVLSMMISLNWKLTILSLMPFPIVSFAVFLLGKKIHKRFDAVQEQFAKLTTFVQENFSGIKVVKSFIRENFEIGKFKNLNDEYLKNNMKLAVVQSLMWPLMFVLTGISIVVVIWKGGEMVIKNEMTIGKISQFMIYLGMMIWPMIAFGWVINIFQRGSASMRRFMKILETEPKIKNSKLTDFKMNSIEGEIQFVDVSFTHLNKIIPTLQNINLKIEKGKTLAIVGRTGSGKSTIANLLLRFYDINSGKILIDGNDIKKIPLEVLRKNIGYVSQETFLFSATLKENISFAFDEIDFEKILFASNVSQLENDVKDFPNQYDTIIGERGITLSGGQKQRTSIARAVITNPKVLILDDALSAVDTATEEKILQQLKLFMQNRTSIIISHRISTVKDADKIIVLDEGKVVECGTHSELVSENRIYTQLYEQQLLEEEMEKL